MAPKRICPPKQLTEAEFMAVIHERSGFDCSNAGLVDGIEVLFADQTRTFWLKSDWPVQYLRSRYSDLERWINAAIVVADQQYAIWISTGDDYRLALTHERAALRDVIVYETEPEDKVAVSAREMLIRAMT